MKFVTNTVPETGFIDKIRVKQILYNLISNSIKFTLKGTIIIKVMISRFNHKCLTFSVEDTGIGIIPEDIPKLFKLYGKLDQANPEINV